MGFVSPDTKPTSTIRTAKDQRQVIRLQLLRMVIQAETQAPNGEIFELYKLYHALTEADLPSKEQVIQDVKTLAETTFAIKRTHRFLMMFTTDRLLFEDQAASEVVRKTMFYAKNENLSASRKPVTG